MASAGVSPSPNKGNNIFISPGGESLKKDQGEMTDDIPTIHWNDEDSDHDDLKHEEETTSSRGETAAAALGKNDSPASVEAKIDKMLDLYISLNDKIQKNTTSSKEKLSDLRLAHNSLVGVIKVQRREIVDCFTRINDLEHAQMQAQSDLDKAKGLIFDLISTVGMMSTRIEDLERISLDQSVEIKERKLILAGIPETKKEDVKSVALEKLKQILDKSKEAQNSVGYKGPKFATNSEGLTKDSLDSVYRMGKATGRGRSRNIFVSFMKASTRHLILKAKNSIDMEKELQFFANEDMSLETRKHRAELKRVSKAARELGYSSKLAGNKIIVEGRSYASNDMDLLPSRILRSGAQEKWVQGGLAFRGEKSVFSNFFSKPFIVEGC